MLKTYANEGLLPRTEAPDVLTQTEEASAPTRK